MRKPVVAGNWKMNSSKAAAEDLVKSACKNESIFEQVDVHFLPPFVYIPLVRELTSSLGCFVGAQNVSHETEGAFTGEVSAAMLLDCGCESVIVGHSERRALYGETDKVVAAKFKAAQAQGLTPILCLGETQKEREAGQTNDVVLRQLSTVISVVGVKAFAKALIAYEPVWAIGTGLTATPDQAQAVHALIRQYIDKQDADIGERIRILYGGSMKAGNARGLMSMPDIDGGLIGGASLSASDFVSIIEQAVG